MYRRGWGEFSSAQGVARYDETHNKTQPEERDSVSCKASSGGRARFCNGVTGFNRGFGLGVQHVRLAQWKAQLEDTISVQSWVRIYGTVCPSSWPEPPFPHVTLALRLSSRRTFGGPPPPLPFLLLQHHSLSGTKAPRSSEGCVFQ